MGSVTAIVNDVPSAGGSAQDSLPIEHYTVSWDCLPEGDPCNKNIPNPRSAPMLTIPLAHRSLHDRLEALLVDAGVFSTGTLTDRAHRLAKAVGVATGPVLKVVEDSEIALYGKKM